ncbi:hypothetical protein MVEN_01634000 [Mycena venus]|uniref:Phytocyanin domain-containing protein n=1 Tax=Mycena venus TaxID=2733690 RepID=A0A8H6XN10_9AGAR|nr:hypothetical protein MVEN_01634000 [Mycena venus]
MLPVVMQAWSPSHRIPACRAVTRYMCLSVALFATSPTSFCLGIQEQSSTFTLFALWTSFGFHFLMRFSLALAGLAAVCSVHADNILIQVGANDTLTFSPSNITAKVGDTIAFQFQSKNHSVTQSSFTSPCVKSGVVDSGFQLATPGSGQLPEYSFNVTDLNPLWFFCAQTNPANHCNAGMVFSVNADETSPKTFAAFQALAEGKSGAASSTSAAGAAAKTGAGIRVNTNFLTVLVSLGIAVHLLW